MTTFWAISRPHISLWGYAMHGISSIPTSGCPYSEVITNCISTLLRAQDELLHILPMGIPPYGPYGLQDPQMDLSPGPPLTPYLVPNTISRGTSVLYIARYIVNAILLSTSLLDPFMHVMSNGDTYVYTSITRYPLVLQPVHGQPSAFGDLLMEDLGPLP